MTSMSTIWDRTTEVLAGRSGMLATIAGLLGFLPTVVQAGITAAVMPSAATLTPATMAAAGGTVMLVALAILVLAMWNGLAIVAATSDPSVGSAGAAMAIGGRRLPVALGLTLLLGLAAIVLMIPFVVILAGSGIDFAAVSTGNATSLTDGRASSALLGVIGYALILFVVGIWLSARLLLFMPVIANERLGVASFGRAFALTRGLTWRIIGVVLLFFLVFAVAGGAAQAVFGLIARLILGPAGSTTARFVAQVAGAAVNTVFVVVYVTFTAQLYRAVSGREAAEAFG